MWSGAVFDIPGDVLTLPDAAVATTTDVRSYRPTDRGAIRRIACETAFRGRGARAVLDDDELFADYWTRYYTDFEPDLSLVAEKDGEVIGYLLGCRDTPRFRRVMATSIVPGVLARLTVRRFAGTYRRHPRSTAFFSWLTRHAWREEPAIDARRFPGHYHANVVPAGHGERLYSRMACTFLDALETCGVSHLHGQVLEERDGGAWHSMVRRFCSKNPTARFIITERATEFGRLVFGESQPLVNRAFAASVPDFRGAIEWIARARGL
jgi:hypothetical protein